MMHDIFLIYSKSNLLINLRLICMRKIALCPSHIDFFIFVSVLNFSRNLLYTQKVKYALLKNKHYTYLKLFLYYNN